MESTDPLVDVCRGLGYSVEYVIRYDGSEDHSTVVVEFPCKVEGGVTVAKEMTAVDQLELVKKLQTVWADNSVSVTVYYHKKELSEIKKWLEENFESSLKSVSFLLHTEHGFDQAPYEEITEEQYEKMITGIKRVNGEQIHSGESLDSLECEGGVCPVK
jgi:hypothetical protein